MQWAALIVGKRKGKVAWMFSGVQPLTHPQIPTRHRVVCTCGQHCGANSLLLEERCRGKGWSFWEGKVGTQQGTKGKGCLPSSCHPLSLCWQFICLIHMIPLGLWFLKHESSAEQATGAGSQPVSAHLQCCAGSSVPKWTSRPQTNLDPRPLSFLIPLSDSQLLSAVMKAASQAKRVLLDSSTIDKVSHVKASRHSWFRAAKQNSGFLWVLVLLNYVQHHIALMLLVSQLLNGGAFNIHF